MPDYRITASSYLNPGQRIAIDVIILNQAAAFSKDVYASLVTVVDLVFPTQQTAALKVATADLYMEKVYVIMHIC